MSTYPPAIRANAPATNRILDLVMFTGTRLSSIFSEILASQFRLGINEWRMLSTTIALGEGTIGDICAETGVHKTIVSRAARELEQRGLVQIRRRKRYVRVAATDVGKQLCAAILPVVRNLEEQLAECIDADSRRSLINTLQQLNINLQKLSQLQAQSA